MYREEVERLLRPEAFAPFVLTTKGGFSCSIKDPNRVLVGLSMIVVKLDNGRLRHVPFAAIDHIDEAPRPGEAGRGPQTGENLG